MAAIHIAYFIDHLGAGGAQRQMVELAVELAKRPDIDVSFITYREDPFFVDRLEDAGVTLVCLPKGGAIDPRFLWRFRRWLADHPTDLLHVFLRVPALWANIALRLLPRSRRPVLVCSERSYMDAETPAFELLYRLIYRGADCVTANATPVVDEIVRRCGVSPRRVHYLPNGIDLAAWDEALTLECPLDIDPRHFNVGLIGRMEWHKDPLLLAKAVARIDESERENLRIWYIGCEGRGDGEYRAKIKARIDELGISKLVRYCEPQQNIAAIMRALDVVALTSVIEGFPNVLLEAMASGTPVMTTEAGNVAWMFEDGECGYRVPLRDDARFAAGLESLMRKSPDERRVLGARGREIVEDRYQMKTVAEAHLELYRSLVR